MSIAIPCMHPPASGGVQPRRIPESNEPLAGIAPVPRRTISATTLLVLLVVLLGLALRSWHYLRDPAVWHDEAALIVNVIGKDFHELLGPLFFAEAAPPLFLWAEKATSLLLGDGPTALRLLPFAASCIALLLLVPVAQGVLPRDAVPWAMLLFACSETLAWHGCEAKPYAIDVLVAVAMLAILVLVPATALGRQLVLYTLLAPVVVFMCYPGCFLYGGVLVGLLPAVLRRRQRATWLGYVALAAGVIGCFATLALGPIRAQRCDVLTSGWHGMFPPWDQPGSLLGWVCLSSVELCRYCVKPLGQFLAPLAIMGAFVMWGEGNRRLVVMLTVPILLALIASGLGAYPYGGSRVLAYATPAIVLLIAAGIPLVLNRLWQRSRAAAAILVLLLLMPLAVSVQRAIIPWQRADAAAAAEYVLRERESADAVIGNEWEHVYYFRHLGTQFRMGRTTPFETGCCLVRSEGPAEFRMIDPLPPPDADRLWIVVKHPDARMREAYLAQVPADEWRLLQRREFTRMTVVLFEKSDRQTKGPRPPS